MPIDQRLLNESLNNDKEQCHNISLWTPGSNSEIKYFEVRLENSNNVTVVPATQWNASLTLCSHEKQTHYKIVAVDKCGQHSDPIPVELKWDIDKGKTLIICGYWLSTRLVFFPVCDYHKAPYSCIC